MGQKSWLCAKEVGKTWALCMKINFMQVSRQISLMAYSIPLENYFPCKRLKKRSFAYRLAVGCIIMLCQAKCLLVSYASSIYAKKQLSFTKFIDKLAN